MPLAICFSCFFQPLVGKNYLRGRDYTAPMETEMKSGTTSLLEMLNLKDVGSALKEKVSNVDCVIPVYLRKEDTGYQAVLHRTSTPMVQETRHLLEDMTVRIGIHSTTGEARTSAMIIKSLLGCDAGMGRLPDGYVATIYSLPRIAAVSSVSPGMVDELENGSCVEVMDFRNIDLLSRIVISSQINHRELQCVLGDEGQRKGFCTFSRVEAMLASFMDDIESDSVLRSLFNSISSLPGAPVILSLSHPEDVIERIEDIVAPEIDVNTIENRQYIQRRLEEEASSANFLNMTDAVIDRISREIAFDLRK